MTQILQWAWSFLTARNVLSKIGFIIVPNKVLLSSTILVAKLWWTQMFVMVWKWVKKSRLRLFCFVKINLQYIFAKLSNSNCIFLNNSNSKFILLKIDWSSNMVFEVTLEALFCVKQRDFVIHIGPSGLEEVLKLNVHVICDCDCEREVL